MNYKVGFIGCGNMGGALLKAAASVYRKGEIAFFDPCEDKSAAIKSETGAVALPFDEVCKNCDLLFFGIKPNIIGNVLNEAKDFISPDTAVISMAAGVSIAEIEKSIGDDKKIIRIMPNTPVSVGAGTVLYCPNKNVTDEDIAEFLKSLSTAGFADRIDEKLIDAAAALSGCGPAFAYLFIEALSDGAVACGLTRDRALKYAEQTLLGAAKLALKSGRHPGELKDAVCSPGGTTIEGVLELEKGSFRGVGASAVIAAYEKTKRLK